MALVGRETGAIEIKALEEGGVRNKVRVKGTLGRRVFVEPLVCTRWASGGVPFESMQEKTYDRVMWWQALFAHLPPSLPSLLPSTITATP